MSVKSARSVSAQFVNDLVITVRDVVDDKGNHSTIVRIAAREGAGPPTISYICAETVHEVATDGSLNILVQQPKKDST